MEFVRFGNFEFCLREVYKVYIIAKRIKTDIWNEKIGKHIAATKASKKAYEKYFKLTRKIWMAFRDIEVMVGNTLSISVDFISNTVEHLKKLQNQ